MQMRKVIVGIMVVLFSVGGVTWGTTYYVATDGNDSNPGTIEEPFLTIQKAADTVSPGDTVLVREGTYYENGKLSIKNYGTEGNWITFQPYNDEEVIITTSKIYDTSLWTQDANGVYTRVFENFVPSHGGLIRKDGYGITRVNTYEELLDPNIDYKGISVLNLNGMDPNNVELYYFDSYTNEVSVKLAYGSPNDIYVIPDYNRVDVGYPDVNAFVEINGFTVQYGYVGIHSYGNHTKFINNTIKHSCCYGGICCNFGDDLLIEDNNISYTGSPLRYDPCDPGTLTANALDHSIYVKNTAGVTIRDNIMERCIGGQSLHPWSEDHNYPMDCEIYNNYVEGGYYGSGVNNEIYNNIITVKYNNWQGFQLVSSSYQQVYNNTIMAPYPVTLNYFGESQNLTFKNNILSSEGTYCMYLGKAGLPSAYINYNTCYGGDDFTVWEDPNEVNFSNFGDYQSYMVNNYNLEGQSFYADPCFVDADNDDYHLSLNSPCINMGDPNGDYDGQTDIDGDPRIVGLYVDMGADEVSCLSWWKLDEANGTTAFDSIGYNNGTVYGAVWTTGKINGALNFDGTNDYVTVGSPESLDDLPLNDMTVSAWIRDVNSSGYPWRAIASCYAYNKGWSFRTVCDANGDRSLNFEAPHSSQWAKFQSDYGTIVPNTWQHVAVVWDATTKTAKLYIDGAEPSYQLTNSGIGTYNSDASRNKEIGRIPHVSGGQYFKGKIDDVRIYGRALSAEEVERLYQEEAGKAFGPNPADGATNVGTATNLSWSPGCCADSHDVYLGTNYNNVYYATTNSDEYMGDFDVNSYDPCSLDYLTTYYWRIDEVNGDSLWKGDVWSFTTTPPPPPVGIIGSWETQGDRYEINGSHTAPSGGERLLVVIAHGEFSWYPESYRGVNYVTYGGQTMTKVAEILQSGSYVNRAYVGAFVLDDDGIEAASDDTISVDWYGTPFGSCLTSVFLENVDQTDPIGAYATAGVTDAATVATSALSTSDGDMVIAGATCTETGTYTPNNSFIEAVECPLYRADGCADYKAATGANETPSVTHSTSENRQVLVGFVVQSTME